MNKPHVFSFTVSYGDSDAAGILYYGRYLYYSEKARLSWMDTLGYNWKDLHFKENVIFPVREVNIIYKKPFYLGDKGSIYTYMKKPGKYHLIIEQVFLNQLKEVCTTSHIKIVCLKEKRLVPIKYYFTEKGYE